MVNLSRLQALLRQTRSADTYRQIVLETALLYREETWSRWYFLLLNRIFAQIMENPQLYEAETAEPTLTVISEQALNGTEAIERLDSQRLMSSANQLTEAYCGMP